MYPSTLVAASISQGQISQLSHILAAANHRQWTTWQRWRLNDQRNLGLAGVDEAISFARIDGLDDVLKRDANTVIGLIQHVVGDFPFPSLMASILDRKTKQFEGWITYAAGKTLADRTRWLLQCRTPFLALPPEMQKSDYAEAEKDLAVVAEAGGLVLSDNPPPFRPQTARQLGYLRARHAIGLHGDYVISEHPWSNLCAGCHRGWSGL